MKSSQNAFIKVHCSILNVGRSFVEFSGRSLGFLKRKFLFGISAWIRNFELLISFDGSQSAQCGLSLKTVLKSFQSRRLQLEVDPPTVTEVVSLVTEF